MPIIKLLDEAFTLSRGAHKLLLLVGLCVSILGCATTPQNPTAPGVHSESDSGIKDGDRSGIVTEALLNANSLRIEQQEREIIRLMADLRRAEEILVAVESGQQSGYTRADAVKAMAEARIKLERTTSFAPWQSDKITLAQNNLETAKSHIDAGRFGTGLFYVYEASGLVDIVNSENNDIRQSKNLLLVNAERVNLRSGPSTSYEVVITLPHRTPLFFEQRTDKWLLVRTPSGTVGWIHSGLVANTAVGSSGD